MNFYDDIDRYSQNIAIIEDDNQITYDLLIEKSDEIGSSINGNGLIFYVCMNTFESIAGYIGFLRHKHTMVLIDYQIDHELFLNLLSAYQPHYIYLPLQSNLTKESFESCWEGEKYKLIRTQYDTKIDINLELALLLTTSGSTGSPKLVRQSYKNITSNANSIVQYLKIESSDRAITTMPMSYTYGLSIINSHLLKGACVIMNQSSIMEKGFWEKFKQYKVTTFGGVPYTYKMLEKLHFESMDLSHLKYLTQAGGKLDQKINEKMINIAKAKGFEFIVMYGQTEATARMSYLPWNRAFEKIGSIGKPIPGGEFWLEDEDGEVVNQSFTSGELVYKGDNVTMGYAESYRDLKKNDSNHGVLHTGDIAEYDEEGFYRIVGRKKRFLKMYGNRINLDEIEQLIKLKGIEGICSGSDDFLKVYVVDDINLESLKIYLSEKTHINRSGIEVKRVDFIPRNSSGKVIYSEIESNMKGL